MEKLKLSIAVPILAKLMTAMAVIGAFPVRANDAVDINCQYQGRPDSIIRFSPGFGVMFGKFKLINSPVQCPDNTLAIQFSGTESPNKEALVGRIEVCLNMASLLVVNTGSITVDVHNPIAGEPGVVIGQGEQINSCRLARSDKHNKKPPRHRGHLLQY